MTSQREKSYAKLREAFEHFPKICQEMEVSRAYCTCNRSSGSPCLMAEGVKKLLQGFLTDFEVLAMEPKDDKDVFDCEFAPAMSVVFASRVFWPSISSETRQVPFYCLESWKQSELASVAEDLHSLLLLDVETPHPPPPEEPEEPVHLHIWKHLVDSMKQGPLREVCIFVAYMSSVEPASAAELLQSQDGAAEFLQKCKDIHLELERREDVNLELRNILNSFAQEFARGVDLCMKQLQSTYARYQVECMNRNETAPESHVQFIFRRRDDLWQSASKVVALASEIAEHVSSLGSPEVKSDCSWSLISESPKDQGIIVLSTERLEEVESAASGPSVGSQISCLSSHGGPHCFLPSHLFYALQSGVGRESPSAALLLAQDLRKGAKILSADGGTIEVTKVEKQKTNKLVELEIDHAMSLTTTPHHRIMVPSESEATTVMAVDLSVGSLVMCSDCMPKKVVRKTEQLVEEQEVLAITFHPDKAVACFLPPEVPVVLTKGMTPKETRRGGMGKRGVKQEVTSIPDTAAGEYED